MGERKIRSPPKSHSHSSRKMAAQAASNLASLMQGTTIGGASIVRCPSSTLDRLRTLNQAEYIILFTPVVPHPPSTELALNMDPFEPLGRSISRRHRRIRHVPYWPSIGLTETHLDFLRGSGGVVVVVCTTENVANQNSRSYEGQRHFAQSISHHIAVDASLASVPLLVVLITNGACSQAQEDGMSSFPALIKCNDYTPTVLEDTARVLFGA